MTKMFPFIVKDMKNVLIYLPQALCACGIYAVCYGLVTLNTGMLARRLQKNGQQPTGENGGLPENGQQQPGKNGNLPDNENQTPHAPYGRAAAGTIKGHFLKRGIKPIF